MKHFFYKFENLIVGETIEPDKDLLHRLTKVLRLKEEEIILVNGFGKIAKAFFKNGEFKITDLKEAPKEKVEIVICVSLIRKERFEIMIEKAVELGATKIIPFISQYTKPFPKDNKKIIERWQKIADEALSQCRRIFKCEVTNIINFKDLLSLKYENKIYFHPNLIKIKPTNFKTSNLIAIGPEGGFSEEEISLLDKNSFHGYGMITNILRTETAVMYALSLYNLENVK